MSKFHYLAAGFALVLPLALAPACTDNLSSTNQLIECSVASDGTTSNCVPTDQTETDDPGKCVDVDEDGDDDPDDETEEADDLEASDDDDDDDGTPDAEDADDDDDGVPDEDDCDEEAGGDDDEPDDDDTLDDDL